MERSRKVVTGHEVRSPEVTRMEMRRRRGRKRWKNDGMGVRRKSGVHREGREGKME